MDAALLVHHEVTRLVVRQDTTDQVRSAVSAVVQQWAANRALRAQHTDMTLLAGQVGRSLPVVESVGGDTAGGTAMGAAIGIVTILFFQVFGYGMMVSQGVVEEKSTRVVEVLLCTVTPLRLMTGKVIGIGAAALLQMLMFAAAVAGADQFWDLLPGGFPAVPALLAAVGWFILGFFFFAFLFAAAGSLVSRAEDVPAAVMPVLMTAMVPYGAAVAAVADPTAPWVDVLRYVPPFSMLIMPLQISVGAAGWVPNAVAALLLLAAAGRPGRCGGPRIRAVHPEGGDGGEVAHRAVRQGRERGLFPVALTSGGGGGHSAGRAPGRGIWCGPGWFVRCRPVEGRCGGNAVSKQRKGKQRCGSSPESGSGDAAAVR